MPCNSKSWLAGAVAGAAVVGVAEAAGAVVHGAVEVVAPHVLVAADYLRQREPRAHPAQALGQPQALRQAPALGQALEVEKRLPLSLQQKLRVTLRQLDLARLPRQPVPVPAPQVKALQLHIVQQPVREQARSRPAPEPGRAQRLVN